jgi:hypothetical protein
MLGPLDYVIWFAGFALQACVVVYSFLRKSFLRYLGINLYMMAATASTVGGFLILQKFGFSSYEYLYFYYYGDALLTVLLYLAVIGLYTLVFEQLGIGRYIRGGAVILLCATAGFSLLVVQKNIDQLTSRFVVELSQNLFFVGLVLSYTLWIAVLKLRVTSTRLVHLVLSVGVYFSAHTAFYSLRNFAPEAFAQVRWISPWLGLILPLAWAFTFTRIPEEARLAPAQVATVRR